MIDHRSLRKNIVSGFRPGGHRRFLSRRYGGSYLPLVLLLFLLYILIAVASFDSDIWSVVVAVMLSAVIALGVAGTDFREGAVATAAFAATISAGLIVAGILADAPWLATSGRILVIISLLITQVLILIDVVRQPSVTIDTILGSVGAYLILGLLWSIIYLVLLRYQPDALVAPFDIERGDLSVMLYFSIVTQTTLGYGDIQPVTGAARAIVQLEALLGQLYIAVLVAWIVGRLVSRKESSNTGNVNSPEEHPQ